jgi:predicted GNAT family acetyltransferase
LAKNVEHIGLNVAATNNAALALYKKLGFKTHENWMWISHISMWPGLSII